MRCFKQVKSKDRVKEVGEVFTDSREESEAIRLLYSILE